MVGLGGRLLNRQIGEDVIIFRIGRENFSSFNSWYSWHSYGGYRA